MKMVWIYIKAFGMVMNRRMKRAMQKKRNVMVPLGAVAVILLCFGGVYLVHAMTTMNTSLHSANVSAADSETEEGNGQAMVQLAEQTEPVSELETEQSDEMEAEDILLTDMQSLADEEVPLAAMLVEDTVPAQENWSEVAPSDSRASSVLQSKNGKSYETFNLLDGEVTTTWQEGEADDGCGTTITFSFPENSKICGFSIVNGNGASEEKYLANNRVKDMTLFIGNQEIPYTLEDYFGVQVITFQNMISCGEITIQIDSVYSGTDYQDTSISEMTFYTMNS